MGLDWELAWGLAWELAWGLAWGPVVAWVGLGRGGVAWADVVLD